MSSPAATAPREPGSLAAAAAASVHLPVQLTSFIGREREIATVRQMLGATRLLTLTGAGGSGKTRLALEVAAQVAGEYPDGLAWVELAALSDPAILSQQIAATLGIREEAGRSATEALLDALRSRTLLLLLDNCEHLADACAALVATLLRSSRGLKILATSREALGVAGERAWLVPPLSLPEADADTAPEQLAGYEAVQLFIERAQDVLPSFTLTEQNAVAVAQVCRRLDGIPLAIELAAARVKVLTPEQIAKRLDNVFALLTSGSRTALPRHRTLRATIDWSYQLLSEPEQLLLQRLSVFAGGFTLEAAEAVCADERLEAWEVLDLLARLVDRSLVVMREHEGAARYHMLETVRQFARERLEQHGDADVVRRRHADFFLAFAETAAPHLESYKAPYWFDRVAAEHDNLRAAMDWAVRAQADEQLRRLAGALWWFWVHAMSWTEGESWSEIALARPTPDQWCRSRALVLDGAGVFAYLLGDVHRARTRLEEAVSLWSALGESRQQALSLCRLAYMNILTGEPDIALTQAQEAVRLARTADDRWVLTYVLVIGLAFVYSRRSEPELADRCYAEGEQIAREEGFYWDLMEASMGRGILALERGDYAQATVHAFTAIAAGRHLRDTWFAARPFLVSTAIVAERGDLAHAVRLLGADAAIRSSTGGLLQPAEQPLHERLVATLRAQLGDEAFAQAWDEGAAMDRARAFDYLEGVLAAPAPAPVPCGAAAVASDVHLSTAEDAPPPRPSVASTTTTAPEASAAPLRVLALGPLEIYREGELLPPDAWRYAKPKELLLYLLSHPEGRTREQIGLVFWPDSSPAQVKNSFHVTLHKLRKVLDRPEWIVIENERYRINPELEVEFDAALFERQITEALREVRAGTGSPDRLRSVLALYRGDFLHEETVGDWHLETRDHLRHLCVEGLFALGDLLMQSERWGEAAAVYQQIVRKEDLHEEAHRRLMLCLARTGERAQALKHYERLVVLLREELDAEPEAETTELYERLRQASTA